MCAKVYTVDELIEPRNQRLYDEVSSQVSIALLPSEGENWSAATTGKSATIRFCDSEFPTAGFTHELLHIKMDLAGYAKPTILHWQGTTQDEVDLLESRGSNLTDYAYNALIHHKIYPDFIKLDYPSRQFLSDKDIGSIARVINKDVPALERLAKTGVTLNAMSIVYPFLFLTSPHEQNDDTAQGLKRLRRIADAGFYSLKKMLDGWNADDAPDVRRHLGHLLYLCELRNIGLAYTKDEPPLWARDCFQV